MVEVIPGKFKPKGIYWIHDRRIAKGAAHYRVCISVTKDDVSFACCTSNKQNQLDRLATKNQHADTLVDINHQSNQNDLVDTTVVNCDSVQHYTHEESSNLEPPKILFKGLISDEEYKKILKGYLLSDLVTVYWQEECNNILNP